MDPLLAGKMHRNLNIQSQGEWLNSTQTMASKGWSDLSGKMGCQHLPLEALSNCHGTWTDLESDQL